MIPSFVSDLSEKYDSKYSFMLLLPQPLGLDMALYLLANVELPQGQECITFLWPNVRPQPSSLCDDTLPCVHSGTLATLRYNPIVLWPAIAPTCWTLRRLLTRLGYMGTCQTLTFSAHAPAFVLNCWSSAICPQLSCWLLIFCPSSHFELFMFGHVQMPPAFILNCSSFAMCAYPEPSFPLQCTQIGKVFWLVWHAIQSWFCQQQPQFVEHSKALTWPHMSNLVSYWMHLSLHVIHPVHDWLCTELLYTYRLWPKVSGSKVWCIKCLLWQITLTDSAYDCLKFKGTVQCWCQVYDPCSLADVTASCQMQAQVIWLPWHAIQICL